VTGSRSADARTPAVPRWIATEQTLGRRVSRGIVLSGGPGRFDLVLHPGDVVWPLFAEPRTLDEIVDALGDAGVEPGHAREYAASLIDDLVRRDLLRRVA
jgi:hypothetical protein